jgi:glutathione S-transferase
MRAATAGGEAMLTVWGRTSSINVQKVMWAVAELSLEHERIDAGGAFGGLDTAEFGAMNPNRKIPTLRDGDVVVWESNASVRYLAACYGQGSLWPEDAGTRARADMWMDWQQTTLQADMTVMFWTLIRTPEPQRDMAAVRAAAERMGKSWQILDADLGSRPFVGGDRLTIGDIPVGCHYWRYSNLDVERPSLPNLDRWFASLKERQAYQQQVMIPLT